MAEVAKSDRRQALDLAIASIDRQFGKGAIMRLGQGGVFDEISVIPTGALSLDVALGIGGIPRGRVTDDKSWRREGMAELRSAVTRGAAVSFGTMPVTSIALMRSDLYTSGARYTGIASVPLSSEYDV